MTPLNMTSLFESYHVKDHPTFQVRDACTLTWDSRCWIFFSESDSSYTLRFLRGIEEFDIEVDDRDKVDAMVQCLLLTPTWYSQESLRTLQEHLDLMSVTSAHIFKTMRSCSDLGASAGFNMCVVHGSRLHLYPKHTKALPIQPAAILRGSLNEEDPNNPIWYLETKDRKFTYKTTPNMLKHWSKLILSLMP